MTKNAEYYIQIYIAYADAVRLNYELAWLGPHTIGRLVDHEGFAPQGSGYTHETLSARVDSMKRIHADFTVAAELVNSLPDNYKKACLLWFGYMHRRPEDSLKSLGSGKEIAQYFNISYKTFNDNKNKAIQSINSRLRILS